MDTDLVFKLAELRGQIAELGSSIRQLQKAGLDSASAQLLITRKRVFGVVVVPPEFMRRSNSPRFRVMSS